LLFGLVMGLALFNKLTILFFGLAVLISLLILPSRPYFKEKWIWLAGIVAAVFLVPYLIWQANNDWYFLGFAQNYAGNNSYFASFPEFLWNQILPNNIFNFPIWLTGLILLLFSKHWKKYRFFGYTYIILFVLLFAFGAKFYFSTPMYSILLVVGAIKIENIIERIGDKSLKKYFVKSGFP